VVRVFCPVTSVIPCQYQSSDAPYSLFYHRRCLTYAIYGLVMPRTLSVVASISCFVSDVAEVCVPVFGQATKEILLSSVDLFH